MSHEIIDIHVHFGAPKDEESGCFWSERFTKTAAYYAMLLLTKSLFKKVNIQRVKKHLLGVINGSKFVNKSVLLAMDQVYDEDGNAHPEKTHLYVPNRYIAELTQESDRILFGASVHPFRSDWSQELDYCLENRAVLCKWIPSSQLINPTHPKCIPFYKKLTDHNLPLLCHVGPEYAVPTSDENYIQFNNPNSFEPALNEGVPVIFAHCGLPYFWHFDKEEYQQYFSNFLDIANKAETKGWNLYADLSAICTPLRTDYIDEIKRKIPAKRLIFASDYPVPLSELCYNKSTNFFSWLWFMLKVIRMQNPLDKNYAIIEGMGFESSVFTNAARLFASVKY